MHRSSKKLYVVVTVLLLGGVALALLNRSSSSQTSTTVKSETGRYQMTELNRKEEAPPSYRWHVDAAPESRLVHGWMLLQEDGDSFRIREHVGAGIDRTGVSEPLDLSIDWFREDGKVRVLISGKRRIGTAEAKYTPNIPKDAKLRVQKQENIAAISEKYQILWRADVVQKNNVISTLVYVARLAPAKDDVKSFPRDEALAVFKKAAFAK